MAESGQALEFKILDSFGRNSIKNNLRSARKQADNVALDLRGVQATPEEVVDRSFSAIREYGGDLNEVIIIGDGYVVIWP